MPYCNKSILLTRYYPTHKIVIKILIREINVPSIQTHKCPLYILITLFICYPKIANS